MGQGSPVSGGLTRWLVELPLLEQHEAGHMAAGFLLESRLSVLAGHSLAHKTQRQKELSPTSPAQHGGGVMGLLPSGHSSAQSKTAAN